MPYTAEISRSNRSCFLFLIDQSASMSDPFAGNRQRTKMDGVADAINRLLHNLILRCATAEGVKNSYDLGVISYGGNVKMAFGGALAGKELIPINEVADSPLRIDERTIKVEDGAGGLVEESRKVPVWFEAAAHGSTPMCEALTRAAQILTPWTQEHRSAFPPVVINITDGQATDGDPIPLGQSIMNLATDDGQCLVFNCHISETEAAAIQFPDAEKPLPDQFAQTLFNFSSVLPSRFREYASEENIPVTADSRGFVFNADLVQLINFLDIGTRASNLR